MGAFEDRIARAMSQAREDDKKNYHRPTSAPTATPAASFEARAAAALQKEEEKRAAPRPVLPKPNIQKPSAFKPWELPLDPNAAPKPPVKPDRITATIRGAAASSGSGFVNAGGTLLEALQEHNSYTQGQKTRLANEQTYLNNLKLQLSQEHHPIKRTELLRKIRQKEGLIESLGGLMEEEKKYTAKGVEKLHGTADRLAAQSAADIATAKDGLGKVGRFAVDLGVAGTQMLGDSLLGGLPAMAVRAAGSAAQEARLSGATLEQQMGYGVGSGILSTATEKISNLSPAFKRVFGKGFADDVVKRLVGEFGEKTAGKILLSAGGEGLEELVEAAAQPFLQRATYDPTARFDAESAVHDALIGFAMGGIGGVGGAVQQHFTPSPDPVIQSPTGAKNPVSRGTDSPVVVAENATTPTVQENRTVAEEAPVTANPSIGAADAAFAGGFADFQAQAEKFHPINQAAAQRTMEERGRAPEEVPTENPITKKGIRKSLSTILNSPLTSNEMVEFLETGAMQGKFDKITITDNMAVAKAHHAIDKAGGYQNAARDFISAVEDGRSVNKYDITNAIVAYNQAVEAQDHVTAFHLGEAITAVGSDDARVVQSLNLFNRMTPAGQLLTLRRVTDRANKKSRSGFTGELQAAVQELTKQTAASREDALCIIQSMIDAYEKEFDANFSDILKRYVSGKATAADVDAKIESEKQAGWVETLGRELGRRADQRWNPNPRKSTVYEIVSGDLSTFMNQYFEKTPSLGPKQTAADRLNDFFNNREEYERAWATAQQQLREKYAVTEDMDKETRKKNEAALAALDRFLTNGIESYGEDGVLLRAVTDAALEKDIHMKDLLFSTAADRAAMQDLIERELVQKAQPRTEQDRMAIFSAVFEYVENLNTKAHDSLVDRLAQTAEKRAGPAPEAKEQSLYDQVASDLNTFLSRYMKPQKGRTRTAAERISLYLKHKAEYQQLWLEAQEKLREKYAKDPAMLEKLDEFVYSTLGYSDSGSDAVMLRAMAGAAMEQDISLREYVIRNRYDKKNLAAEIAANVIRDGQITEEGDRKIVLDAARRFVESKAKDAPEAVISRDIKKHLKEINEKMSTIIRQGAKTKEALAQKLSAMLIRDYHLSPDASASIAQDIVDQFNTMVKDASHAQLESMFKDRPKAQQKSVEEKFTEWGNMGAFLDPEFDQKATEKLFGATGISIDPDMAEAFLTAETEKDRADAWNAMLDDLAKQLPVSRLDRFNAVRYMNMLGNMKTQGRNFAGNVGMLGVAATNNAVNTFLEKASGSGHTRSYTVPKDLLEVSRDYFNEVKDFAMGEAKYDSRGSTGSQILRDIKSRQTLLPPVLEQYRKGTDWAMNNRYFGDEAFARISFSRALAGYLKANGIQAKDFGSPDWRNAHQEFVQKATQFSAQQAQENTFRDSNTLSDWISKIGRRPDTPKAARMVSEGLLPFRKTTANVAVRAEEFSPLGFVNAAVKAWQKKHGGEVTGEEIVSSLSKAFTGSGLFLLGMLLKNTGWLRGADDEDRDQAQQDALTGHQAYSLELPDGTSITLDWLTPAAMPLFMGAQLEHLRQEGGFQLKDLEKSLLSIADPMIEMSMMQGIDNTLDALKYSSGDNLGQLLASSALSYLTQGLTNSLVGQLSRASKEDGQMTFVDKDSPIPGWLQKEIGKASRKMPGDGYHQIPYVDAWGRRESEADAGKRAFNAMLNPAFVDHVEETPVDQELSRIHKETGKSVYPKRADKSIDLGGGKVKNLSGEEYVRYGETKGRLSYETVDALMHNSGWSKLTDQEKAEAVSHAYEISNARAKMEVSDYKPDNYAKSALESGLPADSYILYALTSDKDGNGSTSSSECAQTLLTISGITDAQRGALWGQKNKDTNPAKNPFTGALQASGIPVADAVDIHSHYAELNNRDDLNSRDKPAEFLKYVNGLSLTYQQRLAIKNTYKFFGVFPIKY